MVTQQYVPQVIKDFLVDVYSHLRCEAVPLDHILEVARELVLEGGFMKLLANKCTCLPLVEAGFNLSQM